MIEIFKKKMMHENELIEQLKKDRSLFNKSIITFSSLIFITLYLFFMKDKYGVIYLIFVIPLVISLFYAVSSSISLKKNNVKLESVKACRNKYGPIILSDLFRFHEIKDKFQSENNLTSLQIQNILQKINEDLFLNKFIEWSGIICDILPSHSDIIISISIKG